MGSSSRSDKDSNGNGLKAPRSPSSSSLLSSTSSQPPPPPLPNAADTLTTPRSPSRASDNRGSLPVLAQTARARAEAGVGGYDSYGRRVGVGMGPVLRGMGQGQGFVSEDWKSVLDFALLQHTSLQQQQQGGHSNTSATPVVTAQDVSRQLQQQDALTMGNGHGDESNIMGVTTSCNNNNNDNSDNNSSSSNSMMSRLTNGLGSMIFSAPKRSSSDSHTTTTDAAADGHGDRDGAGSVDGGVVSTIGVGGSAGGGDEIWCRRIHRKRQVVQHPSVDNHVHNNNHHDSENHHNGNAAIASTSANGNANGSSCSASESVPASAAAAVLSEVMGRLVVYVQGR